jgi:hypothetical protein
MFARFGRDGSPSDRVDGAGSPADMPYREKAERRSPPGPDHVQFSSHTGCPCAGSVSHPVTVGEAQISKYK